MTEARQWQIGNRILTTHVTTPAYRLPDPFTIGDVAAPASGAFDLLSPVTLQLTGGNGLFRLRVSRSDSGSISASVGAQARAARRLC